MQLKSSDDKSWACSIPVWHGVVFETRYGPASSLCFAHIAEASCSSGSSSVPEQQLLTALDLEKLLVEGGPCPTWRLAALLPAWPQGGCEDEGCVKEGGFLASHSCYLHVAPVVLSRQIVCQNLKVNICLWGWQGIQRSPLFLSSHRRHNGAWFR